MTKKILDNNKILLYAIIFALIFCTVFFSVQNFERIAFADSLDFDKTDVIDDLESSTVNGEPFDILDFVFDESKRLQIVNFVEYCYTYKRNMQGAYGLYIYIYNPQGLDIAENSGQNKVQMAVSWSKTKDGNYVADRYEKFNLRFCSKSERTNYRGLFYKFKVVDREIDGRTMLERVNSNERRYDISGIELLTRGETNAHEYTIGGTYKFTGYANGYGNTDGDTLSCVVEDLETLKLEVHHTAFRTDVSSKGKNHYNEVNTVYFSIPERIYKEYGNLQKIRAEWWEYKTKLVAITSNKAFYEKLLAGSKLKREINQNNPQIPYHLFTGYSVESTSSANHSYTSIEYDWCFNVRTNYEETIGGVLFNSTKVSKANSQSDMIPMAFYSPYVGVDEVFDFLYSKPVAGDVEANKVAEYVYSYSNELGNGYIDCNGRQISKDLFEGFVDDGRQMGHNDKTIDLADTFDLMSYDSNHSWWDKLWDYGFSWPKTSGDYKDVSPIYEVQASDLIADDNSVSRRLLVNRNDVAALRAFYTKESTLGRRVVLFRFANTDYFSQACGRSDNDGNYVEEDDTDTYVASETMFFDFDIIELTFNKNGSYRVIPVVSDPLDIINGLQPPAPGIDWWKIVLAIIALILLIVLLAPILPYVLKAIWWIITLPFKAIGRVAKSFKNYKDKHRDVPSKSEISKSKSKKKKVKHAKKKE